jgi:2-amino-4-hydroxy-6-hydroxymethyldihydropteridine diphosphokinase
LDRVIAAVALGSNLGDRAASLRAAAAALEAILPGLRVSRTIETEPVDVGPQRRFLNAAAVGTYGHTPADLLRDLQRIESHGGRTRPYPGAPRTLDLDLVLFGSQIVDTPDLCVPHPRFRERLFVLEPLAEIAPEMVDPVTGLTVRELLARLVSRQPAS